MPESNRVSTISSQRVRAQSALCRDCQACLLGCSLYHEGSCSPSLARLRIAKDMARYEFTITICRQCTSPACLPACPTGAMSLDERGVVLIDDAVCTRCGSCAAACPYDAIYDHQAADRYLKCDLCAGRDGGPLCVTLCPVAALILDAREGEH